jgi:hypothetical protein
MRRMIGIPSHRWQRYRSIRPVSGDSKSVLAEPAQSSDRPAIASRAVVGGINITLANVIVAIVILAMIGLTPLAVWYWNRRTGKFSAMQREGVPGWAPPLSPPPGRPESPFAQPGAIPRPAAPQPAATASSESESEAPVAKAKEPPPSTKPKPKPQAAKPKPQAAKPKPAAQTKPTGQAKATPAKTNSPAAKAKAKPKPKQPSKKN